MLGRHVRDRAHGHARAGEIFRTHSRDLRGVGCILRHRMDCGDANLFGESEVQNFCATALGDENVGGLDVPMNDSFTVCGVERVRNPNRQTHQDIRLDRVSRDAVLKRRAFQKFHGDKRFAVLIVNFVNRTDVRMIQGRSRLGFALKAAEG